MFLQGGEEVGRWRISTMISKHMPGVKSYHTNADPTKEHISSTPVVKYLAVIIAYLFKWLGNIKYHRFSAETGQ